VELPYVTADLPGVGGVLRASDDDFVVDEQLPYAPSGAGEHVLARIEKRGLTTPQAVERLARAVGVSARDVGVAGMKDRHAVTRQWVSLPPPVTPEQIRAVTLDGVRMLEAERHPHKLRTGHVRSNNFRLIVRGAHDVELARAILDRLAIAPNWYGEQRFGRDGDNAAKGKAIVLGAPGPRDRRLARLLVSAFQSQLFNEWLIARIADGLFARVIAGDILHKVGGGQFVCEDPAADEPRLGEVVVTGPMFGERMRRPPDGSPAAAREDAIRGSVDFSSVRRLAEGTRRDAAIVVRDASVTPIANGIEVCFSLPGGAYATAVMRELMKC
jgi:tRNA pseudouridine13 synthase